MKLRAKLGLTLLFAVLPVAALVTYGAHRYADRLAEESLADFALAQHESFHDTCESVSDLPRDRRDTLGEGNRRTRREGRRSERAERFADRRAERRARRQARRQVRRRQIQRRRRTHFFGEDYQSVASGPPLDPQLVAGLEESDIATVRRSTPRGEELLLARRMGTGPCAIIAVRRPMPPRGLWDWLATLLPALAAAIVALIAAGPMLRRIRRLMAAVEAQGRGERDSVAEEGPDELSELSRVIDRARQDLQGKVQALAARDEALSNYIASTMHDVMIPLTVLQGHLSSLKGAIAASSTDSTESTAPTHDLHRALEESHYIASLLQNLATAARLEGAVESRPRTEVDLVALVERVMARHKPIAEAKGIQLDHAVPDQPLLMRADTTMLEQAMSNLVHNAVRYGKGGGHVAVILTVQGDGWRFEVLDDGPGVSDEELARLSSLHYRTDAARTRHPEGQGLGLAITRDVAERHGLDLTFAHGQDETPRGLRATLTYRADS